MAKPIYTRAHITREFAEALVKDHGGQHGAVRAILKDCRDRLGKVPSFQAVRMWIQDGLKSAPTMLDPAREELVNQILNVIDEANVPAEAVRVEGARLRSGFHEVITKDGEGNPVITKSRSKNVSVVLSPSWQDGPRWPVVQPAKPVRIGATPRGKHTRTGKSIVVISDTQIGFLRDIDTNEMVPIHDPAAIDLALQIVADEQPDQIGYVGDFLDLPEMSRWLQVAEFSRTTQPALDEGFKILSQFEAAAGPREKRLPTKFVAGNHDRRLREYCQVNAKAAFGLRPAQTTPDSWPDLSIPHLLRFKELGIEYCGEYPGGEWWLTPNLVVRHNPESRDAYAASVSVIAGHTHKIDRTTYSGRTHNGQEKRTLFEIGCLCSLDNYPDKASLMATRVPSNRGFVKNWAQGFAIVHLDDDGDYHVEQIEVMRSKSGLKVIRPNGRRYAA